MMMMNIMTQFLLQAVFGTQCHKNFLQSVLEALLGCHNAAGAPAVQVQQQLPAGTYVRLTK
jgi:hypothetical protein